ncbi:MAG: helix-turn-helix transcriptional regulator [bacterium]
MDALFRNDFEHKVEEKKQNAIEVLNNEIKTGKKKVIVVDPEKGKMPYTTTYFKGWQMSFEALAKLDLTGTDLKVLLFILARLDYDNFVQITQQNIANLLNIKQPKICKAINKLVKMKILNKEKIGTSNYYMLNAEIAWKGKPEKLNNVIDIRDFNKKNKEYQTNKNKQLTKKDCPF